MGKTANQRRHKRDRTIRIRFNDHFILKQISAYEDVPMTELLTVAVELLAEQFPYTKDRPPP